MTTSTFSLEEFQLLLDQFGDDLDDWPDGRQTEGEALLAASPEAKALLNEARRMGHLIRSSQPRAPAGLVDRILLQVKAESGLACGRACRQVS